jgi:hypothetical protein
MLPFNSYNEFMVSRAGVGSGSNDFALVQLEHTGDC